MLFTREHESVKTSENILKVEKNIREILMTVCVGCCSYRVYCMLGDGECSEGSVWEAMAFASYYKLDNLVAILDINRLGQSEPAPLRHDMETYRKRCESFGSALFYFTPSFLTSNLITSINALSKIFFGSLDYLLFSSSLHHLINVMVTRQVWG